MTHLEACKIAATELGVTIRGSVPVILRDGRQLLADMLVENFGAPKGTLVFTNAVVYLPHIHALQDMGYTVSSYAEPREEMTTDGFREMLIDWTWSGPEALRPPWA
jgi:hypothetical protein